MMTRSPIPAVTTRTFAAGARRDISGSRRRHGRAGLCIDYRDRMRLRAATRTTRQGVEARLLRTLGTERRRRLVTELVRVAGAVSAPSAQGALHRAMAAQALVRPTNHKLDEIHTRGLYAVVRETARVDGAIVECGISHGKSLLSLARAAELFGPDKVVLDLTHSPAFRLPWPKTLEPCLDLGGCSQRLDRHFPRTRLQPPGTHQRNLFPAFSKTPWRNSPPPRISLSIWTATCTNTRQLHFGSVLRGQRAVS